MLQLSDIKGVHVHLLFLLFVVCVTTVYNGQGRQCLERLISKDTLREKAVLFGEFTTSTDKTQWVFPQMNFTCPTIITSIRLVGEDKGQGPGRNKLPTVQIWRPLNLVQTEFSRVHEVSAGLTAVHGISNVFSYSQLSWRVVGGDILGFYQPDLKKSRYVLSFQADSGFPASRIGDQRDSRDRFNKLDRGVENIIYDYPLISVSVGSIQCVSGFVGTSELTAKGALLTDQTIATNEITEHNSQTRIVPGITFGCSGILSMLMFAARKQEITLSSNYPEVQVWRRLFSGTYNRVQRISLAGYYPGGNLNVYKVSLAESVTVEQGDILGMYLPPSNMSPLSLEFLQSTGSDTFPESYRQMQNYPVAFFNVNRISTQLDYSLPLLHLEMVANCGVPLPLLNGSISAPATVAGSVAVYSCHEGYNLVGVRERTCQSINGEWSDETPFCESVDCGSLPFPIHGSVRYDQTIFLAVATYECEYGFSLEGAVQRTCTAQTVWSGMEPTCTGIECSSLAFPQNGRIEVLPVSSDTQVGATAQYSCSINYTMVGNNTRICMDNELWSGETPVCVADCPPPPSMANGSVEVSGSDLRNPLFSVATYVCNRGFKFERQSINYSEILICGENSEWMGTLGSCEVIDCGDLKAPDFGTVSTKNGTLMDSIASYNCTEGHEIKGDHDRVCLMDGTWSGNETHCVPVRIIEGSTFSSTVSTDSLGPTTKTLSDQYLAIVVIIAVLTVIILLMVIVITALCVKKRLYKLAMETSLTPATNLPDNSVDNPVYEGDQRYSFNLWNSNLNTYGFQLEDDDAQYQSEDNTESLYEQPLPPQNSRSISIHLQSRNVNHEDSLVPKPSLHYEVSSIFNSARAHNYDEPEGREAIEEHVHHYDTASNYRSSQYDVPVSPYEVPTPTRELSNIYGSLPWGIYVPTEQQRRSTSSSVHSPLLQSRKSQSSLDQVFFAESDVYWKPASDSASLYEQLAKNKYREILREQVQITDHLGSGQFGTVEKGLWQSPAGVMEVAVKTLKAGSTEIDKVKFLQEAAISGQFQHQNVVKLHGVVTMGEPVMIVLELLSNGDLRNYLIRSRPAPGEMMPSDTPQLLLKFCSDIASGMMYLSRKAFVHRDLAARNILVTENKTCKIGDFGLSRDLEDENYYISHGGKIPVKWTSPEALHYKKYSTASDVWSFGCVMYEIWSLGHKPFAGHSNTEAIRLIDCGVRLPPPPGCHKEVYCLMIHCWHPRTSLRPTFTDLHQTLSQTLPDVLEASGTKKDDDTVTTVLGAPLETSKDLFPDLQNFHRSTCN